MDDSLLTDIPAGLEAKFNALISPARFGTAAVAGLSFRKTVGDPAGGELFPCLCSSFIKSSYMPSQSNDSAQPERPIIELEVVRCDEPHSGGRPLFLDARRFIRICHHIERGESASEACRRELVTYRNFRLHVNRNQKYHTRLRQAEEIREHFLREFHIANIAKHADKSVAASMFWLERRYPNEFALRTVIRDTFEAEARAVFDKISMEQLIENARLRFVYETLGRVWTNRDPRTGFWTSPTVLRIRFDYRHGSRRGNQGTHADDLLAIQFALASPNLSPRRICMSLTRSTVAVVPA